MKKHELNETQKKTYRNLFVNRDDVYQRQKSSGIPYHVDSPLTDDVLFNPNENVGAYQLNTNNQVKYAVLDIDLVKKVHNKPDFDVTTWLPKLQEQTKITHDLLQSKGIDSLVEYRASKATMSGFSLISRWLRVQCKNGCTKCSITWTKLMIISNGKFFPSRVNLRLIKTAI